MLAGCRPDIEQASYSFKGNLATKTRLRSTWRGKGLRHTIAGNEVRILSWPVSFGCTACSLIFSELTLERQLRYAVIEETTGTWSVFDRLFDVPAATDGRLLIGLTRDEASQEAVQANEKLLRWRPTGPGTKALAQ